MIKGGYKVIDFYGIKLTNTPVNIPGTFSSIEKNYEKMLILSGVSSEDYLYDDNVGFCTIGDDGDFEIQFGSQKIKVSEEDEVTMTPSGGGGGGVSDYNDLTSKPKINDVTLTGNKNASDLGLQATEQGKGLSSNDFTNTLKTKLDGIEAGAQVNVQSNWNQDDSEADDYIKNKPNILSTTVLTSTLTAGQTTLTFTDASITSDCLVDVYVNHADAFPTDVDDSVSGSITLTFDSQIADLSVKLVIS